jgi:hypothetical protein
MRRFVVCAAAGVITSAVMAGGAQAGLMAELVPTGPVPVGSNFQYNYTINFTSSTGQERLETGDFVTIYDVATTGPGTTFVSATAGPGWSVSAQPAGVDAPLTNPADDLGLLNITYRYVGPTVSLDAVFPGFNVVSSIGGTAIDHYTSQRTDNLGPDAGTKISEIGSIVVPGVPEPSSLAVCGIAGLLLARRRR